MSDYYLETFENAEKEKHYMIPVSEYNRQLARIYELEAQVEALTPKPVVVSEWCVVYTEYKTGWYQDSSCRYWLKEGEEFLGVLRKDTITHPDGRVEYKLEVEG